jgi:putative transposase
VGEKIYVVVGFGGERELKIYDSAADRWSRGSRRLGRRRPTCAASTGSAARPCYKWKAKYGGLEVSDAKRLKTLEDENTKLKKLLAEAMLDNAMLKEIAVKKW